MDPLTISALIGAGSTLAGSLFGNKSPKFKQTQVDRFNPQQQGVIGQFAQGAGSLAPQSFEYLRGLLSGDPGALQAFQAPYQRDFRENVVPDLANRFAGMGSGNLSSSAFQQALARAGTSLEEKLASLRGNLQMSALDKLFNFSQLGLTPMKETYLSPGDPGFFGSLAPSLGAIGGKATDMSLEMLLNKFRQGTPQQSQLGNQQTASTGGGPVATG